MKIKTEDRKEKMKIETTKNNIDMKKLKVDMKKTQDRN